jgi:ATP-dependent Clp protease ATP-binding subunit ClpB
MNFNNFTIKSQEAVQKAVELVQNNGQQVVETPHLFKGILLAGEDVVQFLFGKLGVNMPVLTSVVDSMLNAFPKVTGGEPYLSRETNNVLQKAIDKSSKAGDQFVSLEYILLVLVAEKNQLTKVLHDAGISEKALQEAINELRRGAKVDSASAEDTYNSLNKYAINLNERARSGKLDPVIGRDSDWRTRHG